MKMLELYRFTTKYLTPLLDFLLAKRLKNGKEDPARLLERKGYSAITRPVGPLVHLHAASVGEAQSALILINRLLTAYPNLFILVTSGTITSATILAKNLPARALHQYAPLDRAEWVEQFLNHWRPDAVLWMESELWPNMLDAIRSRAIPAALINARLSDKSYHRWRFFKSFANDILSTFSIIMAQTETDADRFRALGASTVIVTDNIKYSAKALPVDEAQHALLAGHLLGRPVWLYASSHDGEEILAARVHERLQSTIPDLLTIIVPRHPARRDAIIKSLLPTGLTVQLRGDAKTPPEPGTDLYIADTLGELGLFYRLAPVACIGRSFSHDGGGGHNPIEAAQLSCAVITGPHVQYQQAIFDAMLAEGAARQVHTEAALQTCLHDYLTQPDLLNKAQQNALAFARSHEHVIEHVMNALAPLLSQFSTNQPIKTLHAL
jgi:3-deoxy-D-manno-octulosonic-acid transferase